MTNGKTTGRTKPRIHWKPMGLWPRKAPCGRRLRSSMRNGYNHASIPVAVTCKRCLTVLAKLAT